MKQQPRRIFSKRILVVDDDPVHRRAFFDRAREVGVQVDTIPSASLGAAMPLLERYDLLMLNYDLESSFTGLEMAEFLGKKMPHKPVVMVASTLAPWHLNCNYVPNVQAVVSKWDGIDRMLAKALASTQARSS
jgi:CheY-like chemotaxis protein